VRALRVCETCRHKTVPPQELLNLYREMSRHYPKVFYCSKLQAIRVYDPGSPAKVFDCELYEPAET
jgi:hypothetical protein